MRITATTIDARAEIDLTNTDAYRDLAWGNYQAGVADELKKAGYNLVGCDILYDCTVRIKTDVWNHNPDVISILIGINDVWHEIFDKNGVDLKRFERVYRMLIEDTKERLPNVKFILCEPFVLKGSATEEKFEEFLEVKKYAAVVKKLAEEYGIPFVALQEKFDEGAAKYGAVHYLYDGVHPDVAGGKLIAEEWLKIFRKGV